MHLAGLALAPKAHGLDLSELLGGDAAGRVILTMFEKQNNTTNVSNSATDAIMWLKRGLTFVKEFLKNVGAGEKNLTKALQVRQ